MSSKNSSNEAAFLSAFIPLTDEQLLDELDVLVRDATLGNRYAISCIVMAFGGLLLDEARKAVGTWYEEQAADVVQDFYLGLVEKRFTFPQVRGCARVWMRRVIRSLAAEMGERGPGPGEAG